MQPGEGMEVRRSVDQATFDRARATRFFLFVLEKYYGISQEMQTPYVIIVQDKETGLERHYQFDLDFRFVKVEAMGEPPELSPQQRKEVLDNLARPDKLAELLPPELFCLEGMVLIRAVEVTDSQLVGALTRDLIDQNSILGQTGFGRLQERLRVLFRRPDLVAGLAALQDDRVIMVNVGCVPDQACLFDASHDASLKELDGTVYEQVITSPDIVMVPDLADESYVVPRQQEFVTMGLRSLMIAPLHYQDQCVGALSIKCRQPHAFGVMDNLRLSMIQPLFALALKNARDEIEHRVDAVIKEQCTAIHPAVEWRFRRAAYDYLKERSHNPRAKLEPIVFRDVFPFYGECDVRGSSDERDRAVREDLGRHLELARRVVKEAGEQGRLPIFDELAGRLAAMARRLEQAPRTSDEQGVVAFLRQEVESLFPDLEELGGATAEMVRDYRQEVDQRVGTVYRRRRQFEQSVSMLNDRLAAFLDREEEALQASYPHYFERHRTDGVDYLIYAGASLRRDGRFHRLYVHNFRLWQIMVACGLAWHARDVASDLAHPLEAAHLILVHDAPLSIRFRYDEKRFDVDGAYDIRHEIVRSRLGKAAVAGSGERLTQPDHVAMVYSQREEGLELRRHLDYLRGEGLVTGEAERLELEEMPGVQGLRALRVRVDMDSPELARRAALSPPEAADE